MPPVPLRAVRMSSESESAMANAEASDADVDRLYVKTICVDEGPTMRRFRPRAMGRATRINKRTSHVTCVLAERN